MTAIPYALSVHHFISTVGADAGFAAMIGLAIVVLLFFAHARETANLRRRADEAQDALSRLEQYVDQLSRSGPAPVAAPASAVAAPSSRPQIAASPAAAWAGTAAPVASRAVDPVRAPVGAMAGVPGAPAGVGAPALSAATRLIPATDDAAIAIRANRSETVAGVSGFATGASAAAVMDPPGPAPSTTAGGANGSRLPPAPPPAPPPSVASANQTLGGRERRPDPARPRSGATRSPAAAGQRRGSGQRPGGSRIGRGAIALAAVLVVVVVVGVLLVVTNSGGSNATTPAASNSTRPTRTSAVGKTKGKSKSGPAVVPASVTVAVLNGTSTSNLAHDISQKLSGAGYKPGNIATATDQTQNSTIVGYLPNDKRDALAVARSLKLGPAAVQAVDPNNRTIACNGATTLCPAQVIVTVGTDLAAHA